MIERILLAWRDGPTHRRVWALALPMILSNLTVPLVALVDSAVVGHLPHAYQLGAVAVGASFYTVIVSVTGFLRMGTTGLAAQAAGKADGGALRRILFQSLALAWTLAVVLALLAMPMAGVAFSIMQASAELGATAAGFFQLRVWGLPAMLTQYVLVGWLLGLQNARAPLAIMLATNIINITLALWFVVGLEYGVKGAAAAAICAEWTGALLGLWLARSYLKALPGKIDWPASRAWRNWRPLLRTNRDIFIRSLALQGVFLAVAVRGAQLGDATVAANALLLNGLMCSAYALDGLAHAVEALCGHAIGARDKSTLGRVLLVSAGWAAAISVLFSLAFALFGDQFVALQSDIADVRRAAHDYLPYLAVLPVVAVWSYILDGLFIGATRATEMRNAMVISLLLTVPIAWGLRDAGNHGVWIALLCFMAFRALTLGRIAWRLERRGEWVS